MYTNTNIIHKNTRLNSVLRAHVEVHGRPTSLAFLETTQTLTSPHYRLGDHYHQLIVVIIIIKIIIFYYIKYYVFGWQAAYMRLWGRDKLQNKWKQKVIISQK